MPVKTPAKKAGPRKKSTAKKPVAKKRSFVKQTDLPAFSLDQALSVAEVLVDQYAADSTTPLNVAAALQHTPGSSTFRMLCSASSAYGLTKGSARGPALSVTSLGKRIVERSRDGSGLADKRQAFLTPRVTGEFLRKYKGAAVPPENAAINVLKDELGVPRDRGQAAFALILEGARSLGMLKVIKGKEFVDLETTSPVEDESSAPEPPEEEEHVTAEDAPVTPKPAVEQPERSTSDASAELQERKQQCFIAHGKNKSFLEPIKRVLRLGGLAAVVAVEEQTGAKPVPEKFLDAMRKCGAAIIHVDAENVVKDPAGKERTAPNENVLIEIGAAMALYGQRFILLVKKDVKLPSNLQGLYRVEYEGSELDGDTVFRLMDAVSDIKEYLLPEEDGQDAHGPSK